MVTVGLWWGGASSSGAHGTFHDFTHSWRLSTVRFVNLGQKHIQKPNRPTSTHVLPSGFRKYWLRGVGWPKIIHPRRLKVLLPKINEAGPSGLAHDQYWSPGETLRASSWGEIHMGASTTRSSHLSTQSTAGLGKKNSDSFPDVPTKRNLASLRRGNEPSGKEKCLRGQKWASTSQLAEVPKK